MATSKPHRIVPLPFKPSRLEGLSERLIGSHYVNNYGGAVRRLNAICSELARLDPTSIPGFVLNGLKREELIARNSMVLHEAYFASLGGRGDPEGRLAAALEGGFGSVGAWRAEFSAMGKALGGGSGWVMLTYSARAGRLVNQWAADHSHVLADGAVVLALDMYEHAYHIDFGADAGAYVDRFMQNLAWASAAGRFARAEAAAEAARSAPLGTPDAAAEDLQAARNVRILDVRKREDFAKDPVLIPGAEWRDPAGLDSWAGEIGKETKVVVYCVWGGSVSEEAAVALRARGLAAGILVGGLGAWRAAGGVTQPAAS